MVKVLLAREVVGERDRRETRRRLLGKRKGKKDKDAFRRNQPPTTIHQDNKTRAWTLRGVGEFQHRVHQGINKAFVIVIVVVSRES